MFTNANVCYSQTPYINSYVNSGGYQVKISNKSGLSIILKLSYSLSGTTHELVSPNIEYNSDYSAELPDKSTRITIDILDNSDPENPISLYKIPLFYARNACYLVTGTGVSSTVREVPCSSLGSSENTCSTCCCCMCNCKQ